LLANKVDLNFFPPGLIPILNVEFKSIANGLYDFDKLVDMKKKYLLKKIQSVKPQKNWGG